jgi:hypothetical protein
MAQVQAQIIVRKRWFFWPALIAAAILGKLGLIRGKASAEHFGGIITGQERVGRWIADHAMRIEVR